VRAMQAANVPERAQAAALAVRIAHERRDRSAAADRRFQLYPFVVAAGARADMDQIDLVRRALRAIPPEQATALVLRLHEGFGRTNRGDARSE